MYLTDEEQKLFDEGITLSADKLIPSMVYVDDDEDYQFSAYLYATTDSANREYGYLHFRLYDGTTDDFDPALSYEGRKISEVTLSFEQEVDSEDEDISRFIFNTSDGAEIKYFRGESQEIFTPSQLNGLSLLLASKIFFIDIIRILRNSDNNNYSLN
jgi:hypothetical protein